MITHFVWINNNGKPYPQKWYGTHINTETGKDRLSAENVLKKVKLSDKEAGMSIEELRYVYPIK